MFTNNVQLVRQQYKSIVVPRLFLCENQCLILFRFVIRYLLHQVITYSSNTSFISTVSQYLWISGSDWFLWISISYNLKYKFLLSHLTILKLDLVFLVSSSFSQMFATSKTIINNFLHLLFNQNAQNSIKTNHNSWPGILFHWTRIISTSQSFVGKTFFP